MLLTVVDAPASDPNPTLTLSRPRPAIVASPATISRAKPVSLNVTSDAVSWFEE